MTVPAKYAGLPDIDDAADVYETHDPPSINPQHDSESEDSLKRPWGKGERAHEGGSGNGNAVDGRRLVPGRGRVRQVFGRRERGMRGDHYGDASSASSSEEEETDPSDAIILRAASRTRETPQARLRRLRYEMNQLERDLQHEPSEPAQREKRKPGPTSRELLIQLAALRDRAEGLETNVLPPRRAAELVAEVVHASEVTREQGEREGDPQGTREGDQHAGSREALRSEYVAELDRRLHVLEQRIGTGTVDETTLPDSILATLRKTSAIQSLLITPHTLDAASRRVKVLLADLARVSSAGHQKASASQSVPPPAAAAAAAAAPASTHPDETEKINAAYALLPRLDPILPLLSPLLTRLRALATLHANASTAHARLVALEQSMGKSSQRTDEAREVVQRVERQLAENARAVEANWKSVEVRLGDLQERLERIG